MPLVERGGEGVSTVMPLATSVGRKMDGGVWFLTYTSFASSYKYTCEFR